MRISYMQKIFEIGRKLVEICCIKVLTHNGGRYFCKKNRKIFSCYPQTMVVRTDPKNEKILRSDENWSNAGWGGDRRDP